MNAPQDTNASASPEQIGTLANLVSPLWWLVLAVILSLSVAITMWAVAGEVYVTVSGLGVVMPSQGVIAPVVTNAGGRVSEIKVAPGQEVKAGEVVLVLYQERLSSELDAARESLNALLEQQGKLTKQNLGFLLGQEATTQAQIDSLEQKLASLQQALSYQTGVLADLERELAEGFATRSQVEQARTDKRNSEFTKLDTTTQIRTLRTQLEQTKADAEQQLFSFEQQILQAKQQERDATLVLALAEKVKAPIDGLIESIATTPGKSVAAGDAVMLMVSAYDEVRVAAYFQIDAGKQISPGTAARVQIHSIDADIYGTAVGQVVAVADLPSTTNELQNLFENDTLVSEIQQGGATLQVLIDLETAPPPNAPCKPGAHCPAPATTSSRYIKLASGRPTPIPVTIGTTITAQVIVEQSAPISYVISLFR